MLIISTQLQCNLKFLIVNGLGKSQKVVELTIRRVAFA